ncbi:MAG: RNA pseudouridine synthase [Verrucomicrobiales bacterium]|nr:RNA pseudouridine synthase [Verrucomicrobiales bacterium]
MSPTIRNNTRFTILDEGTDYLVVNKPAPLQVHPKKPGGPPTLWDELTRLLAFEITVGGQVSIINRLDRETSGVTLIAKTPSAARRFGIAMQQRQFRKTYLAWTIGTPSWQSLSCHAPILSQRLVQPSDIYVKQIVHPHGSACQTEFRVLHHRDTACGPITLIEATPVTGRMHQIRVHLSHLGHPILGDKLYGPSDRLYLEFIATGWTPRLAAQLHLPRHALHAWRLEQLDLPQHLSWQAPIPPDLAAWGSPQSEPPPPLTDQTLRP